MNAIQQHLVERVAHYTEVVREKFPSLSFNVPQVGFFSNKKAAGYARRQHTVEFNTVLAEENREEFDNTIIHELAHLVMFRMYPLGGKLVGGKFKKVQPHGPEFKQVMATLGGRPNRCHQYDVSSVKARTRKVERQFEYKCGCAGKVFKLTSIRHNRIAKGHYYRCNTCQVRIVPLHA